MRTRKRSQRTVQRKSRESFFEVRVAGCWIGGGESVSWESVVDVELVEEVDLVLTKDVESSAIGLSTSTLRVREGMRSCGITPCSDSCSIITCSTVNSTCKRGNLPN